MTELAVKDGKALSLLINSNGKDALVVVNPK